MAACKLLKLWRHCFSHRVHGVCAHGIAAVNVEFNNQHLPQGGVEDFGVHVFCSAAERIQNLVLVIRLFNNNRFSI